MTVRRVQAVVLAALLGLASTPTHAGLGAASHGLASFAPGRILNGATRHRILHFTFDDGPAPVTTPALLDALDRLQIKATFFFSSSRFADRSARNASARELALEVKKRGHAIGSHSFEHKRMRGMSAAQITHQLDENERTFREIFGGPTYLFRPPWGSRSSEVDRQLASRAATTVLWNLGSADWTIFDAEKLRTSFARALPYLERTKGWGGGIVLMHDTHPWTVEALPRIVGDLRARNCALLAAGNTTEELYDILDDLSLWDPALDPARVDEELARRQRELRERTRESCGAKPPAPAVTSPKPVP